MLAPGVGGLVPSTLVSRNVRIAGRRTSVRLEREMWDALTDISKRENIGFNPLCTYVAATRREGGFTSNLRVFIMNYFRDPAHAEALRSAHTTNASTNGNSANAANVDNATAPATSSGAALNLSANR
jgi:predicted DNA-binding ribbon-helix-helix protein